MPVPHLQLYAQWRFPNPGHVLCKESTISTKKEKIHFIEIGPSHWSDGRGPWIQSILSLKIAGFNLRSTWLVPSRMSSCHLSYLNTTHTWRCSLCCSSSFPLPEPSAESISLVLSSRYICLWLYTYCRPLHLFVAIYCRVLTKVYSLIPLTSRRTSRRERALLLVHRGTSVSYGAACTVLRHFGSGEKSSQFCC
jgi:hypothetical protein